MSTLRELTGERLALQDKLEALDLDEQTILDTLEGAETEIALKIENYGYVIRNMESFVEAVKAEEERMTKRRRIAESRVGYIKEWLFKNMVACDIKKIECPAFTIAIQNNPAAVVIDSESLIPSEFMRQPEPPPPSPDKKAIAAAIKDGLKVAGAHLAQSQRLVIK